jgi:hypothetical protein
VIENVKSRDVIPMRYGIKLHTVILTPKNEKLRITRGSLITHTPGPRLGPMVQAATSACGTTSFIGMCA